MQDNAPIHTNNWSMEWLRSRGIPLFVPFWPPYSLDMNPIEHAWARLRDMLKEIDPTLQDATGPVDVVVARLKNSLQRAWRQFLGATMTTFVTPGSTGSTRLSLRIGRILNTKRRILLCKPCNYSFNFSRGITHNKRLMPNSLQHFIPRLMVRP